MTDWRTQVDTEWADERTVIDPRYLDAAVPRRVKQPSRLPPRAAARFKELVRTRLLGLWHSRHKVPLAFAGLGVLLVVVTGFAIREHAEANALREELRFAEHKRVDEKSDVIDPMPLDPLPNPPLVSHPSVTLTATDRARAEQEAIDFTVMHNYDAALNAFEALRNAFPERQAYSDLVDVLRWKLRCGQRGRAGGRRCD